MDASLIKERIEKLKLEQFELNKAHDFMVEQNNARQTEFNAQVTRNQQRFQQLGGAIAELETLLADALKTETSQ